MVSMLLGILMSVQMLYLLAALLPAIVLLRYIYRMDKIEKEPGYLLKALFIDGVISSFLAIALEFVGEMLLDNSELGTHIYREAYYAFLVVAAAEEGSKLLFLKRRSWNDPNFNYLFDGIVYAVFVSLGFAAIENVNYVFSYGLGVAVSRAFLAVPGHMVFSVFMGIFYGRAKLYENQGHDMACRVNLLLAFFVPMFFHGFYDACLMLGSDLSVGIFMIYIIVLYPFVFWLVRRSSRNDRPI